MDILSSAGSQMVGPANFLADAQANRNTRAVNATSNKWAPLLAFIGSKGKADETTPKANFTKDVIKPLLMQSLNSKPEGGGGMGGGSGMGESSGMGGGEPNLGVDTSMPMPMPIPGLAGGGYNKGGMCYACGGMTGHPHNMAMGGGVIPGRAMVPGNSPRNDTQLTMTSPDEVVLPRTIAKSGMDGNKWKVAAYLNAVKHHGPGPLPPSTANRISGMGSPGSSISPMHAMSGGGKMHSKQR